MALTLPETVLLAERASLALAEKMAGLTRALSTGNPDRIGNAAHEADMAAIDLSDRLGAVFSVAADQSSARWDAAHIIPPAKVLDAAIKAGVN